MCIDVNSYSARATSIDVTIEIEAIDNALENVEEVERDFIKYRYFYNWTIDKCSLRIGYSDKTLFLIRNQVIKKFLIRLGSITII
ncbi:hypothetical protein DJ93_5849 [Bacillus clarus]|uniref:Sigma-70, region 4 family protein n=1 Tax=Bacillus clarus TaxID=2338372 RepID=A0A090Y8M3_9BACI|nr:hypothetical protein DJ93_5849 [Bacillus clarus]